MKLLKKVMLIAALSLSGCLFAQAQTQAFTIDTSLNVIVQGKAGKMTIFKSLPNFSEFVLSRNGKFLMGRTMTDDGDAGVGIIYEIATKKTEVVNGSVIEVVDWKNYLTTAYAIIDGKEEIGYINTCNKLIVGVVEEASADLLTVRASLYLTRKEYDYANVLIETKTGKILDTLNILDPTYNGGMNMGWNMSDDAKIVGGRASLRDAVMNYSPVFWDLTRDKVYSLSEKFFIDGEVYFQAGQMWGVNGKGTMLCGDIHDLACYVRYDRATGQYTKTNIPRNPGFDISCAYRVNNNGVIVGTEQMGVDIYSRNPFICFTDNDPKNDRKYMLADFLLNLYGLNGEQEMPLMTLTGISDDGRFISGYSYADATWYSYLIELAEHQTPAPVRNAKVENLPRRSMNVVVSWQEPMKGEYTLTGYNIYRDKQKIGSVGIEDLTYTDEVPENGRYKYFVQAVYGDKESDAADTLSIIVLNPDECLPVLEMFSSVEYNRTVSLAWNLPSDKETQNVVTRPKSAAPKYIPKEGLDFVSVFQPAANRMSTGVRIGDYIYAGSYNEVGIFVYDQFGNTIKQIPVENVGDIYDMTYREKNGEGYFYVATGQERVLVLKLNPDDPFDITYEYPFTTALDRAVSITYVENDNQAVNKGEDYLIVGNYRKLVGYPIAATGPDDEFELPVKFDINDNMSISGTEYYKGRLYVADQGGTNGCDLIAYEMATGKKIFTTDLFAHPTVDDASSANGWPEAAFTGGLVHSTLPDGTEVLECLLQCQYTYNMIVDMELESSEDVLGYVVYRNNKPVSDTLQLRHFTENLDTVGTYTYHIEYLSTRGCSSSSKAFDVTRTEVIYPKGEVAPPRGLRVYESNGNAVLTWNGECLDIDGFVGFNLYRNGKQIGKKNFRDVRYTDSDVKTGTKYQYCLTAFFDDSGEASDTVEITLTGKGVALEPSVFRVEGTVKKDNDSIEAKASWGLPYFEEPMAYGYCSFPAGGNSLGGTSQMSCIIGWDAKDMDKFDEDLYLVGVEFAMACSRADLKTMNTIVFVDDTKVYEQPYNDRFQPREWTRVYFNKVFKMKQEMEIAVGYSVTYDPDKLTSGIFANDEGPGVTGKSDLVSPDGVDFGSLKLMFGVDVNLCINALVVRQRDFAEAASAPDPQEYLGHKTMRLNLKGELGKGVKFTDGPKTTSEGIRLLGFNLYRDSIKLNKELMTDFSYEENVARGDYEYVIGAVYDGLEEQRDTVFAEFSTVGIEELQQAYQVSVYPNPVSDVLNIKGDYVSFMLVDMNGRVLMRDVRNTESVSLAGLNDGVYFMLITLPNGDKRSVKVIKR